jgi:hypothetical protein
MHVWRRIIRDQLRDQLETKERPRRDQGEIYSLLTPLSYKYENQNMILFKENI